MPGFREFAKSLVSAPQAEELKWYYDAPAEGPPAMEMKSAGSPLLASSFVGHLQDTDNWDLSFAVLIQYFERCAPFSDAVNRIAEGFAELPLYVRRKSTGEMMAKHPLLTLLQYPNDSMSQADFLLHFASMFLITGNPYIQSFGPITRPPASLDILNPQHSTVNPDRMGDMDTIRIQSEFMNVVFRGDNIDGRKRFRAKSDDNELWPVFSFNPRRGTRHFFGTPIAKPLYNDIEQYIYSGRHNKSLLKRGARPGGVFSTNDNKYPLTDAQFRRMQDQVDLYFVGADNAGRPMLFENVKYEETIINNRDMDYKTLTLNTRTAIYRQFKIPLPTVEQDAQTFSNYQTSQVAEYDKAILPVARFLLGQLTSALMYRFEKDWRDYELWYNEKEIPELAPRRMEVVKTQKEINVSTVNELRVLLGLEERDGGDVILRPANEIPPLEGLGEEPPAAEGKGNGATRKALEAAVDYRGRPVFTKDEIDHLTRA